MTEVGRTSAERVLSLPGHVGVGLTLAWGAATDTGKRRAHNEDSFIAESPVFAVADGMGGHAAGEVASAAVVTRLAAIVGSDFGDAEAVTAALNDATTDISGAADDNHLGVGTTATGAVLTLQGDEAFWTVFNVGDSRVYRFESNELIQVTVDHSVVQELVAAGLIAAEEAEEHPESNVITRAVGFDSAPRPDFWMIPVRKGSRLLVCSDGLSKEVDDEHIRLHLAAGLTPAETAQALVDAALASGGRDNVTTVVVDVIEASDPVAVEQTIPRHKRASDKPPP
ncbi:protein phosphatase 2C domain-containing protein [soil metagenome]